jgi:hypothetical protein
MKQTLRPKTPMLKTLNEAAVAVDELLAAQADGKKIKPTCHLTIVDGDESSTEAGSDVGRIDDVEEDAQDDVSLWQLSY